ncbi:MAG: NAD(P)/FAD-dependent oxidoreductase [Clostridiaceae bacterium]|nr:NAD(P)/FAD-dependent oxidoreductase [Clostridiaceae bacterium]
MKVTIIGGGAAGMMAACIAAARGRDVTVLERNPKTCRKLCITGKGRCNLTNACPDDELMGNIPGNGRFLYSALSGFSPKDVMRFFEDAGVPLKIERGSRVFPVSDSSYDIADALLKTARSRGVRIIEGRASRLELRDGHVTGVWYDAGVGESFLENEAVILATGGASYPTTGSTGDGYRLAEDAGHTVVPLQGSLVPLEAPGCTPMQGLSLKNTGLKLYRGGKLVYEDFGEMLFTHFGVSGPMILSASARMRTQGEWKLVLDCKPALSEEQLDARILRDFADAKNRDFENALGGLLPRLMIPEVIRRSGIDPHKKVNEVTRAERRRLITEIKRFEIPVTGKRPLSEAVVTAGGVDVREVNPKTMASKLVRGLYFAGEVLDVDAYTGGFNLQIAWSTGYAAGSAV